MWPIDGRASNQAGASNHWVWLTQKPALLCPGNDPFSPYAVISVAAGMSFNGWWRDGAATDSTSWRSGTYPVKPSDWSNAIALYERLPPTNNPSVRLVPILHNVSLIMQMLDAAWLL